MDVDQKYVIEGLTDKGKKVVTFLENNPRLTIGKKVAELLSFEISNLL